MIGQLKTTLNILPPQTNTGKEGSSCRDVQTGRGCFLCGMIGISSIINSNIFVFLLLKVILVRMKILV